MKIFRFIIDFFVINLDSKKILVYNLINQQVAQNNIEKCMKKQICKIIKTENIRNVDGTMIRIKG